MSHSRWPAVLLVALSVYSGNIDGAHADHFFRDTFDDGDHEDGTPATWAPGNSDSGTRNVSDGRLVHTPDPTGDNMSTFATDCLGNAPCYFSDVSLTTSYEVTGDPTFVTLTARSLGIGDANATLYGGTNATGEALLAMSISTQVTFLAIVPTGLNVVGQDVNLRFDVKGSDMDLWMWVGTEEPATPTASAQIPDTFPWATGTVGFFYNPGASSQVAFDFIEAAAIPEPSSWFVMVAATVSMAARRRCRPRHHRGCQGLADC